MVHKVLENRAPQYLYNMFALEYNCNTRQAARLEIRQDRTIPDKELTMASFRWRAVKEFNKLPTDIRQLESVKSFKTKLWRWIFENVSIG